MRKLWCGTLIILIMSLLVACGQTATPTKSKDGKSGSSTTENISDLTLSEVLEKSTEANKNLKSFSTKMDLNYKMNVKNITMDTKSKLDMKIILDPINVHQKMEYFMTLGEQKQEQSVVMDMYLTEDGFFMFEPTQELWMKLPIDLKDQFLELENSQTNPADQLEELKNFEEDFTFEQDNENFILTLKAEGEKFEEFLKETAISSMPEDMQIDASLADFMTFNNVEYEIYIDKETFFTSKLNIMMDIEADLEGEKMNIVQEITSSYAEFNAIDSIEVPQEALDNAKEIDNN
ncbi:MAG TPA: DUF6612 family protein [Bacillaceae bacterium]|nr:DUF6612 family protein [Paenibacillus bovis]HLU21586.1 DUF6612 family protein [Bacillaceae bacterium]